MELLWGFSGIIYENLLPWDLEQREQKKVVLYVIEASDQNVMHYCTFWNNGLQNNHNSHLFSGCYALKIPQIEFYLISQQFSLVGIIPTFPVGKLRIREVNNLHKVTQWENDWASSWTQSFWL